MSAMQINININRKTPLVAIFLTTPIFNCKLLAIDMSRNLGKPTLNPGLESREVEFMESFKVVNNILQLFVQSKTLFANAVGYTNF